MVNGGSYLNSTKKAEGFDFSKNSQAKLDMLASGWILHQKIWII